MSQQYLQELNVAPCECACSKCQRMCQAPCCGSVEDFENLIEAGYANRLMFDDLPSTPDGGHFLKPALKGYEGERSPWSTSTPRGCTFWNKERKCDLHDLGLKPTQGKIAIHDELRYSIAKHAEISKKDWESERGLALIKKWKKIVNYQEPERDE